MTVRTKLLKCVVPWGKPYMHFLFLLLMFSFFFLFFRYYNISLPVDFNESDSTIEIFILDGIESNDITTREEKKSLKREHGDTKSKWKHGKRKQHPQAKFMLHETESIERGTNNISSLSSFVCMHFQADEVRAFYLQYCFGLVAIFMPSFHYMHYKNKWALA